MHPLPRANTADRADAISPEIINRLFDEVTRLGKFTVNAPLYLSDGPGGRTLVLQLPPAQLTVVDVYVVQNGGSNGTVSPASMCSFTYDVYSEDGTIFYGSEIQVIPGGRDATIGPRIPATQGMGILANVNLNGTLVGQNNPPFTLLSVVEGFPVDTCGNA